jgi:hypothetical protein
MMELRWAIVLANGLFAFGTLAAALRSRAWTAMDAADFKRDFARTIAVADRVQPALAAATVAGIVASLTTSDALETRYAVGAAVTLVTVIALSVAILVPLQRRIIDLTESSDVTVRLRLRWIRAMLAGRLPRRRRFVS